MSQAEPTTAPPPNRPRRRRRRWLIALGAVIFLFVGLVEAHRAFGRRRLARAIAEAAGQDPDWRLEAFEAHRAAMPDARNGALRVLDAAAGLSPIWTDPSATPSKVLSEGLGWPPDEVRASEFRALLAEVPDSLRRARELADLPTGRFPDAAGPRRKAEVLARYEKVHAVRSLLAMDALVRARDGDADGAMDSLRGMLNVGRAVGDEPTTDALSVRSACGLQASWFVENLLAQAEPGEAALARLQAALREELETPLLPLGLRALRAESFARSEALGAGEADPRYDDPTDVRIFAADPGGPPGWVLRWMTDGWFRDNQATMLAALNPLVAVAGAPVSSRNPAFLAADDALYEAAKHFLSRQRHLLAYGPVVEAINLARADDRRRILEGCAVVLLAAERYRRARGHLPESLDALVPQFLPTLPALPYGDGRPHLAVRDGAWIVYGMDERGKDHKGVLLGPKVRDGNMGLRLRDIAARRRPAPSTPPSE